MITRLRCVWETETLNCTKYAATACLLNQLAEWRLTEMTRGCLDTKLSAWIHSVSLAGSSREMERVKEIKWQRKRGKDRAVQGRYEWQTDEVYGTLWQGARQDTWEKSSFSCHPCWTPVNWDPRVPHYPQELHTWPSLKIDRGCSTFSETTYACLCCIVHLNKMISQKIRSNESIKSCNFTEALLENLQLNPFHMLPTVPVSVSILKNKLIERHRLHAVAEQVVCSGLHRSPVTLEC